MRCAASLWTEYALLLLILVGVPFACAWLGGCDEVLDDVLTIVPQTDDWQSRPEMLWNCRCPFRWWAFWLVGGSATALVAPFLMRAIRLIVVSAGSLDNACRRGRRRYGFGCRAQRRADVP